MRNRKLRERFRSFKAEADCLPPHVERLLPIADCSPEQVEKGIEKLLSLSHPNVARVHSCVREHNSAFIMAREECYSGECLWQLSRHRLLNPKKTMMGLTLGLDYLHREQKMIHKLICPGNVLVAAGIPMIAGGWPHWDCCDLPIFSNARLYLAPEALYGEFGYQTDIWPLGLIFLELALHRPIFASCQPTPTNLQNLTLQVEDSQIRQLIRQMLRLIPKERPTTVDILCVLTKQRIGRAPFTVERVFQGFKLWATMKQRAEFGIKRLQSWREQIFRQKYSNDLKVLVLRAVLQYNRGNDKEAQEWCVRAIKAGSWEAYCVLAQINREMALRWRNSFTKDPKVWYEFFNKKFLGELHFSIQFELCMALCEIEKDSPEYKALHLKEKLISDRRGLISSRDFETTYVEIIKSLEACPWFRSLVFMAHLSYYARKLCFAIRCSIAVFSEDLDRYPGETNSNQLICWCYIRLEDVLTSSRWYRRQRQHQMRTGLSNINPGLEKRLHFT